MDETWIDHYTPETKRSSAAGESHSKRPKTQQWESVFTERGRKRPPPWTLPAHGFFLAPLP